MHQFLTCLPLSAWLAYASLFLVPLLGHALCWSGLDGKMALALAFAPLATIVLVCTLRPTGRRAPGKDHTGRQ